MALPASAADIRDQLTPNLIYNRCQAAGIGSETEGTVMLPNGGRVAGSVLCTAEDLAAANAMSSANIDREDDADDEHENEDHGDDNQDD